MDQRQLVRQQIAAIKNGVFVEIGTFTGEFADFILCNSQDSKLYCIDPYVSYDNYDDAINKSLTDDLYNKTVKRLTDKFGSRITFIRKFSSDAVDDIPSDIDLLYIDGNHQYQYVFDELQLYFSKVKSGRSIIGDAAFDTDEGNRDASGNVKVVWSPDCYGNYGVIKAFRDFARKHNISYQKIGNQCQIVK